MPPSSSAAASAPYKPDTYNYVVSASRETVIDHCVSGSFTGDASVDTICAKGSRIEVRTLQDEEEKLVLVCTQLCFGRITCLKLLRNPQQQQSAAASSSSSGGKEWLFVVTDRPHFFLFSFDHGKLVERGFGKLGEMLSKPVQVPLVVVEAKSRFVLCHLFHGLLSVIVFDGKTGGVKETFITSLEELNVLDLEILPSSHSQQQQVLCVLHEDNRDNRHVKTYALNHKNLREMMPGPWNQPHVEGTAHKLMAALDGVLLFSASSVAHLRENTTSSTSSSSSLPLAAASSAATPAGAAVAAVASSSSSKAALITTLPIFLGRVEAAGYVERDGSRILIGDESGSLYVLAIARPAFAMTIEFLGDTSVPTRLCYLDAGLVFVASRLGDSQLVRLLSEPGEAAASLVEVVETFTNLGPIVSMCLMDMEKKGQLVTCSGGVKDGSLRIVRNGVGVDEQCSIDLPGILGMWSVKSTLLAQEEEEEDPSDDFLVQAYSMETRVLGFAKQQQSGGGSSNEVVLGEMTCHSLFDSQSATLFCGNVFGDWFVQVTASRVRFMRTWVLRDEDDRMDSEEDEDAYVDWEVPEGKRVTLASSFISSGGKTKTTTEVLLALTGGVLAVVALEAGRPTTRLQLQMEHEISAACALDQFICVALWSDLSVRVLDSRTGKELHSTATSAASSSSHDDALATSMALCRFSSSATVGAAPAHLLVGYGDGRLVIYSLDDATGRFFSKRTVPLGSLPVELTCFVDVVTGSRYVFAACDRPSIVYCAPHAAEKVLLSNVNIPATTNNKSGVVSTVASFNSTAFPNCLALASEDALVIGMVNDVQKIHVKSVFLGERPSRIAHQPSSGTFGVCVHCNSDSAAGAAGAGAEEDDAYAEQCRLRLVDDRTFKVVDSFRFDETELPLCILSTTFVSSSSADDAALAKQYYVVGTAYANDDDPEPSRGRILVFEVGKMEGDSERRLFVVTEKTVKGGVYDLCTLASGKLVAGVNAKIQVFSWTERSAPAAPAPAAPASSSTTTKTANQDLLLQDASFHGCTLCLNVRSFGDYIVVGDMVKSVSLLHYDGRKNKLVEVSRALPPSWVTSLAVLEDSSFLIANTEGNLVVLRPDRAPSALSAAGGGEEQAPVVVHEDSVLVTAGDFYWGDFVNCMSLGSLTMRGGSSQEETASATAGGGDVALQVRAVPKLVFGTASGAIGVLATLTEREFALLDRLQVAMDEVCVGAGQQRHSEWRAYRANGKTHPSRGFIDGDLIETLMELDGASLAKVCERMNQGLVAAVAAVGAEDGAVVVSEGSSTLRTNEPNRLSVEDLLRLVEDLTMLH